MHFLLLGFLRDPTHKLFLLDYRLPFFRIPLELSSLLISHAWGPADEDDACLVSLAHLHEAEDEDVGITADEAFDGQIPKLSLGVGGDFVVL